MSESYGVKSSPKDVDVQTATQQQLKLLSSKDSFKVYKWGLSNGAVLSGDFASEEIAHNLGYSPAIMVFAKSGSTYYPLGGVDDFAGLVAYSDSTKLYLEAYNSAGKLAALPQCKYYILVDKVEEFSGFSNVEATGDMGIKASLQEKSIDGQEYDLTFSSKYKSLQYFEESIKSETLTLPFMRASFVDQEQIEYQYVDFNHGFGYPPVFMAWFKTGSILKEIPVSEYESILANDLLTSVPYASYEVFAQCDSTKIRVWFRRTSKFDYYQWVADGEPFNPDSYTVTHSAQTITITVLPFAENLAGLNYGQ